MKVKPSLSMSHLSSFYNSLSLFLILSFYLSRLLCKLRLAYRFFFHHIILKGHIDSV